VLAKFHRVLITSGIVLGLMMVIFAVVRWAKGDDSYAITGAIGAVAAIALAIYLRWFLRKSSLRN
jgi:hypothetical protein